MDPVPRKFVAVVIPVDLLVNACGHRGLVQEARDARLAHYVRANVEVDVGELDRKYRESCGECRNGL